MGWEGQISPRESGIWSGLEILVVADRTAPHLFLQVCTLYSDGKYPEMCVPLCTEHRYTMFLAFI